MQIKLTDEIEQALVAQAKEIGIGPEQLALESLRERFVHPAQHESPANSQGTLADYLAGSVGVLHSQEQVPNGARLSEHADEAFAEGLLEKRRHGRL